jgi:hypothetical protein
MVNFGPVAPPGWGLVLVTTGIDTVARMILIQRIYRTKIITY